MYKYIIISESRHTGLVIMFHKANKLLQQEDAVVYIFKFLFDSYKQQILKLNYSFGGYHSCLEITDLNELNEDTLNMKSDRDDEYVEINLLKIQQ